MLHFYQYLALGMIAFILFDKLVDCLESNTLIVKINIFLIESLMIGWYIRDQSPV